jgi:hypothetical protein
MKTLRTILILSIFLIGINLSAKDFQKGMISGSAGLSYGLDIEELGISVGGLYSLNKDMRVGAEFTYWLYSDEEAMGVDYSTSAYEINGHYHYIFYNEKELVIYGIGALGFHIASVSIEYAGTKVDESDSEVAIGLGAGFEYSLGGFSLYAEPKYFISGFDQLKIDAGVRFYF